MRRTFLLFLLASTSWAQPVITTAAGADWLFPADGQPAVNAPLGGKFGMALTVDRNGNFYIADQDNGMVMRVGPDGILNVIAGNGLVGHSGDGGPATAASLGSPVGVAVDAAGNIYISDGSSFIRKILPDGTITTIAGVGQDGVSPDGVPALGAALAAPGKIALDPHGNLYFIETQTNRVREITPSGTLLTVAGNGRPGNSGDGGPATQASLNVIEGIAFDGAGSLYIAISSPNDDLTLNVIRKVSPSGIISTVAGGGASPFDNIPATQAVFVDNGVAADSAGNVYISDFGTHRVRKIDTNGVITTVAGRLTLEDAGDFSGDGGPAVNADLNSPFDVAVDSSGNIYIADGGNTRVREVTPDGVISTVAGNGQFRLTGDGGPATGAALFRPNALAVDANGNYYISEQFQNRVRKVARDGAITVFAGNGIQGYNGDGGPATRARLFGPAGVAADTRGNVYIADQVNFVIRKVAPDGTISTVAGNGRADFAGDNGLATSASLDGPSAVAVDAAGNLYIADTYNQRIRKVDATGIITTIAGNGRSGFAGDNGPALQASLSLPVSIALDAAGNIYFAEYDGERIRRVSKDGIITTVAGNGRKGYSGDNGPATSAMLGRPWGLTLDAAGNLYFADLANFRIRKVSTNGIITTVAGNGIADSTGDGGPATSAALLAPIDVALDKAGNLLIAEWFAHRIRAVLASPPAFQRFPASLSFTGEAGAPAAAAQTVSLAGSIPGVPFSVAAKTTDGGGWLQTTPAGGAMPTGVAVTADPSQLAPGTYQGTLAITAPNANPPVMNVAVAFKVSPPSPAQLDVKADSVSFSLFQGSAASTQALRISNDGGAPLDFTVAWNTSSGSWLSVAPASGTLAGHTQTALAVTADPTGLAPGTYTGTVAVIESGGDERDVPVTMTVSAIHQSILLLESGLTFTAVARAGVSPPQAIGVANIGQGVMNFSVSATTLSGGTSWLTATSAGTASDAAARDVRQVIVSVDPAALAPGQYYGQVQIDAPSADNSPQFALVVLNVLPEGSDPGPLVQPAAMIFTGVAGAESPGSQTITVSNLANTATGFTSGKQALDGKDWFQYIPAQATLSPGESRRIVVQPDTTGLDPGVYRATLTLLFSGGISRSVNLVFIVTPGAGGGRSGRRVASGDCSPTKLVPVLTSLSSDLSVPAGWPQRLLVRVVDDCGDPLLDGSVITQFSNNDPPLALQSLKNGNWSGTWQARNAVSQVTIKVTAQTSDQQLEGTAEITGGLQANPSPPILNPGGVVSAASLAPQVPLAPGSLISILGTRLASGVSSSPGLPWPMDLGGTLVAVGGRALPLVNVSDGRIDAILPYDLQVNAHPQLIVRRGNTSTVPQAVTIAPSSPAIFTQDNSGSGQGRIFGIAAGGTQVLASPVSPAHSGDQILIQCTGLGAVDQSVIAGIAAPDSPPAVPVTPVSVSIGGMDAPLISAMLEPGASGIYLVTVKVPDGVAPGDAVPVVLSVPGQSSPPVTMAVSSR